MKTRKKHALSIAGVAFFGLAQMATADETGIGQESNFPLVPVEDEAESSNSSLWDEIADWFVVTDAE